jgi:hypothetical protein
VLSQGSKEIVASASGIKGSGSRKVAKEILEKRGKRVSHMTIYNERYRQGLKPFHVIAKPLKTNTHIEDRKWLAKFVDDWTEEDFMNMAPSNECNQKAKL